MAAPAHRPRLPLEALVDKEAHPRPRRIPTTEVEPEAPAPVPTLLQKAALGLLGVFVLALALAGFLGAVGGSRWGLGFLGLALGSLVASYLLGAS